jgi:hypothetical protein
MSTIPAVLITAPPLSEYDSTFRRSWLLGPGDDGEAVALPRHADRTVQVTGTFGGATVKIEGTLDDSTWAPLTDPQGNVLTFTSYPAGYSSVIEAISEAVVAVRPVVVGGTGTNLTITLFCRS